MVFYSQEQVLKGQLLIAAAKYPNKKDLIHFINDDAPLDYQDENGDTPLIHAAKNDDYTIIKILLDSGASPDIQNNDGDTALIHAVKQINSQNTIYILALFLDKNADLDIPNHQNDNIVDFAVNHKNPRLFQIVKHKPLQEDLLATYKQEQNAPIQEEKKQPQQQSAELAKRNNQSQRNLRNFIKNR